MSISNFYKRVIELLESISGGGGGGGGATETTLQAIDDKLPALSGGKIPVTFTAGLPVIDSFTLNPTDYETAYLPTVSSTAYACFLVNVTKTSGTTQSTLTFIDPDGYMVSASELNGNGFATALSSAFSIVSFDKERQFIVFTHHMKNPQIKYRLTDGDMQISVTVYGVNESSYYHYPLLSSLVSYLGFIYDNKLLNPVTNTYPISATSLPLPTGASTEATLSSLNGKIPANLTVSATKLLVDNGLVQGLTDTQLRASAVSVTGSRSNAGSDTTSGKTHLTVGGSDGTNLRPLSTTNTGVLNVTQTTSATLTLSDSTVTTSGTPTTSSVTTGAITVSVRMRYGTATVNGIVFNADEFNSSGLNPNGDPRGYTWSESSYGKLPAISYTVDANSSMSLMVKR